MREPRVVEAVERAPPREDLPQGNPGSGRPRGCRDPPTLGCWGGSRPSCPRRRRKPRCRLPWRESGLPMTRDLCINKEKKRLCFIWIQEAMESSAFPNNLQCMLIFCQMTHTQKKNQMLFYSNLVGQQKFLRVFRSTPHRFAVKSGQSVGGIFVSSFILL